MPTRQLLLSVLCVACLVTPSAQAQFGDISFASHYQASGDFVPRSIGLASQKGQPILSRPCDPMMTARREAELLSVLSGENSFDWRLETPLMEVVDAVAELVPIRIDRRALEEIGIEEDVPLIDRTRGHKFDQPKKSVSSEKWWTASTRPKQSPNRPLGAVLETMLNQQDLVFEIRGGEILVTTLEWAEEAPPTRLYDVKPIVRSTADNSVRHADFDSLMNLIQTNVVPDSWEALGGVSTMSVYSVHGHDWLIVTAPTMVHRRVQSLLDSLNR